MLQKFEVRKMLANIELLEQIPFFKHWSKNQIKKLLPSLNIVEAVRGQILIQEGLMSEDIYIVRKGTFSGFRTFTQDGNSQL